MDGRESVLPNEPVPADLLYSDTTPVLFGHYWMRGEPHIVSRSDLTSGAAGRRRFFYRRAFRQPAFSASLSLQNQRSPVPLFISTLV